MKRKLTRTKKKKINVAVSINSVGKCFGKFNCEGVVYQPNETLVSKMITTHRTFLNIQKTNI